MNLLAKIRQAIGQFGQPDSIAQESLASDISAAFMDENAVLAQIRAALKGDNTVLAQRFLDVAKRRGFKHPDFDYLFVHLCCLTKEFDKMELPLLRYCDGGRRSVDHATHLLRDYGRFKSVIEILPRYIKKDPFWGQYYSQLAAAYLYVGEVNAAVNIKNQQAQLCGFKDADRAQIQRMLGEISADGISGPAVDLFRSNEHVKQVLEKPPIYGDFQSLGENCELGFVQAKLNLYPLDLFRWGAVRFSTLIQLLDNEFLDFGLSENCELVSGVHPKGQRTFDVKENLYKFQMHTFVSADDVTDPESFLKKFCARLQYLRRKLLEDLREGNRIFLYKRKKPLNSEEIESLSRAVRAYGPNRLLIVQEGFQGMGVEKRLEVLDKSTLIGKVPRFELKNIDYESWIELMDEAYGVFHPQASSRQLAPKMSALG